MAITFISSCGDDDPPSVPGPDKNIYELVKAKAGYDITVQAIDKAGLKAMLSSTNSITFFPPSNDALLAAGIDVGGMTADELKSWLEYHIVEGSYTKDNLPNGGYIKSKFLDTLNGRPVAIFVEYPAGIIELNGYQTIQTKEATNGYVHFMVDALTPLSIFGHIAINPDLAIYKTAVQITGTHRALLEAAENKTVFATNLKGMETFLNAQSKPITSIEPSVRRAMLENTTIDGEGLFALELSAVQMTMGLDLDVTNSGKTLNGDVSVLTKDIQCSNGVLHIINDVIIN